MQIIYAQNFRDSFKEKKKQFVELPKKKKRKEKLKHALFSDYYVIIWFQRTKSH